MATQIDTKRDCIDELLKEFGDFDPTGSKAPDAFLCLGQRSEEGGEPIMDLLALYGVVGSPRTH